jgi:hypothetical protein
MKSSTIFTSQTTPRNNKRQRHSWCCRKLFKFLRFFTEIMRQLLHGRCSLCVGKPERIRSTGEAKEPCNCFSALLFPSRGALISKSVVPEVQKYWMRRSQWLTISRVGHYSRGCFQRGSCSLVSLTAHGNELAISGAGASKVLWTEGRNCNFSHVWRVWAGWPA